MASCLAFAGLWLASGCAFPVFSSEPRDARAYAYAQPARDAKSHASSTRGPTRAQRTHASVLSPEAPEPRAVEQGSRVASTGSCFDDLSRLGVTFEVVPESEAPGVQMPMHLTGPLAGVTFAPADHTELHAILDCRLALALYTWAGELHRRGVVRVEHYSMYRPNAHVAGSDRVSGHAHGLAIDAARFLLEDGTQFDVLDDWEGRQRGDSPCPMRPDEGFGSRLLRSVTCEAVDEKLFQVVITPHHDRAHQNHVHLERKPDVDWTYVR